jgi:hypothetical protein
MDKIIQLEDRFPTGEPTVQAVLRAAHGRFHLEKTAFLKTASPALDYIQSVVPEAGHTYILVNALGAFEAYDSNRNGDGFNYRPYRVGVQAPAYKKDYGDPMIGWVSPEEVLTRHYHTFEQAHAFQHHINKDPGKSFGNVQKAFWNDRMQRVELLLKLLNDRNPQLVERINDGDHPAVSMGCRVKWDVCTLCGNRAPTRKDYCEHLRYRMNEIDPSTGIRFCALNPSPFFFDISFVTKPADQTGYMLKKVAHEIWSSPPSTELEEKVAAYNAKQATVRKLSDIQKRITGGEVIKSKTTPEDQLIEGYRDGLLAENTGNLPVASDREVTAMSRYPLRTVLATLHKVGAFLSTGELARVFLSRNHTKLGSDTLGRLVLLQPAVLEAFARYPDAYDKAAELVKFSEKDASSKLLAELQPWIEKRSTMGEYLQQRVHEPGGPLGGMSWGPGYAYETGAPAKTDMMTMTDPHTGVVYRTTRGASQAADAANRRAVLGGTALLGGAYTLGLGLVPHLPLPAKLGLGLGAGYLTARKLLQAQQPYHHPAYMTDQGTLVPGNTEFMKSSSVTPSVQLLNKLAYDYVERLGGWPVGDRLEETLLRKQGSTEILSLLHGNRIEKVANLLSRYESNQYDSSEPPKIGFHHLSDVFGQLVAGA